ncbi:RNA polymerase [grass carp rhabdovirus]|uniref:RNA-directed RNA polymerase L n=1 Tax=grass carp rhabdovirus TaxID=2847096 RepID=L7ZAX0_9RHAB|nr:RNA polymerase [Grass carp virus]AGE10378.1 RNA polymerase [Grass carp virus]
MFDWESQDVPTGLPDEDSYFPTSKLNVEERMHYLNNVDYNLNSPLISDDIEYLSLKHFGRSIPALWRAKNWEIPLEMLKDVSKIRSWDQIHPWMGKWFDSGNKSPQGESFLRTVQAESEVTAEIPITFLKGWIGKDIKYPVKQGHGAVHTLMQKVLDLHKLTLLINSVDSTETNKLCESFGLDPKFSRFNTHSLGVVRYCPGWIFIEDASVLLDRNFLLMMKDTLIGRLQTLLSMLGNYEMSEEQIDQHTATMLSLYSYGDQIISKSGNDGYSKIKLLEPICNLRLSELAHTYRPLVPDFPHFKDHVETSVRDEDTSDRLLSAIFQLVQETDDIQLILTIYGSFRHWGHPFISYFEGLQKLHDQVTLPKQIDRAYAEALASDLAYTVLQRKFSEEKKWYVDPDGLPARHPLKEHIENGTWPTAAQTQDFGDRWNQLPLTKCFEIPDLLDPSVIYSDKSHSMNRREVLDHVATTPNKPIPSKKVLETMLNNPATDWPSFLKTVDEKGLPRDSLIIGLKGKERELKIAGRFFSLMSWQLREYFVITEYLIKTHYVPLFKGLTMADDLTSVVKKMLDNTNGQGLDDYSSICIANHIDYEKWNNHQRKESNGPVFRVMGQFLGYPRLFERTHEFFESSLIYYNGRPDLMDVRGDSLINTTDKLVCWEGQAGGLEGLRQKGWSVLNLLVINRESSIRNTVVKVLAQGDNQVICTQYKTKNYKNEEELKMLLSAMVDNNQTIMDSIVTGTGKLGLIINNDETMQSADYLNYGKVPVFRGILRGLETKRWSRVTCITNDQIPTLAGVMSSVSTNALTVAHFAASPINAILQYHYFANFCLLMIAMHNPAIRSSMYTRMFRKCHIMSKEFRAVTLYLDPSLGGVCGISLARFLIRAFPDPVTEGLSFWKLIYHNCQSDWLKKLAKRCGNPKLARFRPEHIPKIIEDPAALNISMGMSASNLLKTEVKGHLIRTADSIQNQIIREAAEYLGQEEESLNEFLWDIEPFFPRFLSEFRSSTFVGVTDSLIGLFQNSKTIRGLFRSFYKRELDRLVVKSELSSLEHLGSYRKETPDSIWECSSSQADLLREQSWGRSVIGMTVPHPLEMFGIGHLKESDCVPCQTSGLTYISSYCPKGINNWYCTVGSLAAYLGSKTSETTSILQPWEKDSKVPIIRRATKLRDSISWFVQPDSKLAKSIQQNLKALTGEDWAEDIQGFKRTGSALHRFTTSRISNGGFSAQSPAKLTRIMTTTDTMRDLGDQNYDFMFQAGILYSQMTTGEMREGSTNSTATHYHISCKSCLREIQEPMLESRVIYNPPSSSRIIRSWIPGTAGMMEESKSMVLRDRDWEPLTRHEKSYHIGRCQGFLYGDLTYQKTGRSEESSIFPLSIQYKVEGGGFLKGFCDGIIRASAVQALHRRVSSIVSTADVIYGGALYLTNQVGDSPPFQNLCRAGPLREELERIPHKMTSSYPTSNSDMGYLIRNYLKRSLKQLSRGRYETKEGPLWIFSDVRTKKFLGPFSLSSDALRCLYKNKLSKKDKNAVRNLSQLSSRMRTGDLSDGEVGKIESRFSFTPAEMRHACKFTIGKSKNPVQPSEWSQEAHGSITSYPVFYSTSSVKKPDWSFSRLQNPTISGLRVSQQATGAHYKLRSILKGLKIHYQDAIGCGDGSGGLSSCMLRENKHCRVIFNSLLELTGNTLRGSTPDPPSAINGIPHIKDRCVNLENVWEHPSDLSHPDTWKYFKDLKDQFNLDIDLIVMDMEVQDIQISRKIEQNLRDSVASILSRQGTVVYKTYMTILAENDQSVLETVGVLFEDVQLCQTQYSSSQTSEVYCVMRRLRQRVDSQFVDWQGLVRQGIESKIYCNQPLENEFQRALGIYQTDTLVGVPRELIPNLAVELETLLEIGGLSGGILGKLVLDLEEGRLGFTMGLIVSCILISEAAINTTRLTTKREYPSSGSCQRMAVCLMGAAILLSIQHKSIENHKGVMRMLKTSMPIRITHSPGKEGKLKTKWSSVSRTGLAKDVRLMSNMAGVGAWIRVWSRMKTFERKWEAREADHWLKLHNQRLSIASAGRNTGVITVLHGTGDRLDRSVPTISSAPRDSGSWVE